MFTSIKLNPLVYTPAGKSGLIDNLHINVSHKITSTMEGVQLDHMTVPDLIDHNPFHSDLDLSTQSPGAADPQNGSKNESDEDPCIVERIVDKRFNAHKSQYEYLVKWLGYDTYENTWELPTNIPTKTTI